MDRIHSVPEPDLRREARLLNIESRLTERCSGHREN